MSGYLEVKYPFKSVNPFKSWKRQWCILRPSPTCSGGSLAVYCSEAGAAAGTVDLPSSCVVRRAKSRTRPFAFAVFSSDEPRKPRILLAALSLQEAQSWMEKIRALLNGDKMLGTETLLRDSYSVSIVPTDLSRKCEVPGPDCVLTVSSSGLLLRDSLVQWTHVTDALLITEPDKTRICIVTVDSEYRQGGGELRFSTPLASELTSAIRQARKVHCSRGKLSRSDGDLRAASNAAGEFRRSSWYSGPSEVSLDDIDLVMSKESKHTPSGQLARCSGAGDLAPAARTPRVAACASQIAFDDSMSDRRSLLSIASGIYEEIPDLPEPAPKPEPDTYCPMARAGAPRDTAGPPQPEPTYECVADCIYATMRRTFRRFPPPPLPPRLPFGTMKLGDSWNSRMNESSADGNVTRHSSLGSLPRCCSASSASGSEQGAARRAFSVFRKRLKSDSRLATSPKSDTSKENKDVETKKKKFDFTPTRDIFKNFRKMKNLKIGLGKGETKSCEFLDETEHVASNRCSKSVECLEDNKEFVDELDGDLSIEFNDDAVAALALPQEIVDLILRSREQLNKIRLKDSQESAYTPMSPILPPPPMEHHYIVMSPKTNIA